MPGFIKTLVGFLILLFIACTADSFSQVPVTRSQNKVIIEGKVYYIHIVKAGQTLFSISRAYDVSEKDIAIENPGVYAGLQVGQVLKIPADNSTDNKQFSTPDTIQYLVHTLAAGETVFSLSKKYNVTVDDIIGANQGIDIANLSIGQGLNIPRLKTVWSEKDFDFHKVRRKETLYSLSQRYKVTEKDIREYNPELQWGGLRTGQVIRIPRQEFLVHQRELELQAEIPSDSQPLDSLYQTNDYAYIDSLHLEAMSLDDYSNELKDFNSRKLNVAFLIPFNYQAEPDTININSPDTENSGENAKEELYTLPRSINFLEFFEGSLLALDSLRREGAVVNVRYFDTHRSPTRVREILNSPFFRDVDLIIGPFFSYNAEIVSEFSRENKVPMVSPFYEKGNLTMMNPYLFQITPSYKTEYLKAADVLSKQYDHNFVFIYRKDPLKYKEIEYFKSQLLHKLENYIHAENIVIKEISYDNPSQANLKESLSHAFSSDKKNIVIIPENDEAFVSTVITQLYFQLQSYKIEVFGSAYFNEFQNIDFQYYHALRLSYLTPFYYDYMDPQVDYFLRLFRDNFKSEPRLSTRSGCPYALIGYDMTYYFIKKLHRWDKNFVMQLNSTEVNNILPNFYFNRNNPYGGFENQAFKLVRFEDEFNISIVDPIFPDALPKQLAPEFLDKDRLK